MMTDVECSCRCGTCSPGPDAQDNNRHLAKDCGCPPLCNDRGECVMPAGHRGPHVTAPAPQVRLWTNQNDPKCCDIPGHPNCHFEGCPNNAVRTHPRPRRDE
jgi:hypothetical protein